MSTRCHATLWAQTLLINPRDKVAALARPLGNTGVNLNPHQAALDAWVRASEATIAADKARP